MPHLPDADTLLEKYQDTAVGGAVEQCQGWDVDGEHM